MFYKCNLFFIPHKWSRWKPTEHFGTTSRTGRDGKSTSITGTWFEQERYCQDCHLIETKITKTKIPEI